MVITPMPWSQVDRQTDVGSDATTRGAVRNGHAAHLPDDVTVAGTGDDGDNRRQRVRDGRDRRRATPASQRRQLPHRVACCRRPPRSSPRHPPSAPRTSC